MSGFISRSTAIAAAFIVLIFSLINGQSHFKTEAYPYIYYGIDVSKYQGSINWNGVASSGIEFAIIRAGTTNRQDANYSTDINWNKNYTEARAAGLKVGAYYYCGAGNESEFISNAKSFVNDLGRRKMQLPVFIDVEVSNAQMNMGKNELTKCLLSAMKVIESAGYTPGVYANKNWFTNYIDVEALRNSGCVIWWAQYPSGTYAVDPLNYDKSGVCKIWQYSDKGRVNGISENVDLDVSYYNFDLNDPINIPIPPDPVKDGYFKACSQDMTSIVDALKSIGADSSFSNRQRIAECNGISGYSGTASQNIEMLELLKSGMLLDPDYTPPVNYQYYPKCETSFTSIVDALKSIGIDSSFSHRQSIASANGITNYAGTSAQNIELLNKLKQGTLISVDGIVTTTSTKTSTTTSTTATASTTLNVTTTTKASASSTASATTSSSAATTSLTTTAAITTTTVPETETTTSKAMVIIPKEITIAVEEESELAVLNCPEGEMKWIVSNKAIAKIENGIITGLSEGETMIYAVCGDEYAEAAVTVTAKPEIKEPIKGDIDGDGEVTAVDMLIFADWLMIPDSVITEDMQKAADINSDGRADVYDFILLRQLILKD